jgi:hypothetical protein
VPEFAFLEPLQEAVRREPNKWLANALRCNKYRDGRTPVRPAADGEKVRQWNSFSAPIFRS